MEKGMILTKLGKFYLGYIVYELVDLETKVKYIMCHPTSSFAAATITPKINPDGLPMLATSDEIERLLLKSKEEGRKRDTWLTE